MKINYKKISINRISSNNKMNSKASKIIKINYNKMKSYHKKKKIHNNKMKVFHNIKKIYKKSLKSKIH